MKTIKFSHNYPKLHGQTEAELLAVKPIKIDKNTPEILLRYDTVYLDKEELPAYYPLEHGNYIQLIFLGNLRIPFCTIRSAFPQHKVDYYKNSIGETFRIGVKGE